MRKGLSSKLLSVVLAIAICASTVFGCLMTVSAATDGTYTFGTAEVSGTFTQATVQLDIALTSGEFSAGMFVLEEDEYDAADHLVLKNVVSLTDGLIATCDTEELSDGVLGTVFVEANMADNAVYNTASLMLVFGFSNEVATEDSSYPINATSFEFAYSSSAYYTNFSGSATAIVTEKNVVGCKHVLTVNEANLVHKDTANNYAVYSQAYCTLCETTFGYQLVPTAAAAGGQEEASNSTICWSADGAYDDTLIDAADGTQDGSVDYPIIINSVEELYSLAIRTPWTDSLNKYYKLADGIKNVVLQSEDKAAAIMALSSSAEVNTYFSTNAGYSWGAANRITKNAFAGHFDGNGATFYGLYSKNKQVSGLFPIVHFTDYEVNAEILTTNKKTLAKDHASISNLNVTNSYIYGTTRMGFISGEALLTDSNSYTQNQELTGMSGCYADWYLQLSNCSIYNNYMYSSQTGNNSYVTNGIAAGSYNGFNMYGSIYSGAKFVSIDNCLVYGNTGTTVDGYNIALFGQFGLGTKENSNNHIFTNSIILGTEPYYATANGTATFSAHSGDPGHFYNIYSDALTEGVKYVDSTGATVTKTFTTTQIKPITSSDILSSAAINSCNLNWGNVWLIGDSGKYPYLVNPSEKPDTIYWDNSIASSIAEGSGTSEDPYIINTASELAYVVKGKKAQTTQADGSPAYFKIADGIKNIVLQPYAYGSEIMNLNSATATKDFFDANADSMLKWPYLGWEASAFCGNFDGNGAIVYGLYQPSSTYNAGLFATVDAGATIKNIGVKNSYMVSQSSGANYQVGAIAAVGSSNTSYNTDGSVKSQCAGVDTNGLIGFKNIVVANNYMYNNCTSHTRSGVVVGSLNADSFHIDNCLVYGNNATYGSGEQMYITGQANNSTVVGRHPADIEVKQVKDGEKYLYVNVLRNAIVIDTEAIRTIDGASHRRTEPDCFENVYTTGVTSLESKKDWDFSDCVYSITKAQAIGTAAKSAMSELKWGTDWYCGTDSTYPELSVFATVNAAATSTGAFKLYASNTTYNDDGSLNFNFHYLPAYEGFTPTLYVGTKDGSKFMKLDTPVESCYRNELGDTAMMFTIPNISARDIDLTWIPTLVTDGATTLEWGNSQQIALADNAMAILTGEYDQADKNVAAALLNYGNASDAALSSPAAVTEETNIVYAVKSNWNAADGSFMDVDGGTNVGNGTKEDPFIVSTPGHIRYLAQNGTYATTYGKYFAVDPTIDVMCFQYEDWVSKHGGIDKLLNFASAEEVQSYFESVSATTDFIRHQGGNSSGDYFGGYFDGNGVRIVGLYTETNLFGYVSEGASFKNITVENSYIKTTSFTGALVGQARMSTTYLATATNKNCYGYVSFDKIVVRNNYIASTATNISYVGVLMGNTQGGGPKDATTGVNNYLGISTSMTNCIVYDNKAVSLKDVANPVDAGLFGALSSSHNPGDAQPNGIYEDSIILGCVPYGNTVNGQAYKPQYYKNIYTDRGKVGEIRTTIYSNAGSSITWEDYDITVLNDVSDAIGFTAKTAMPRLAWGTTFTTTSGYPTFINSNYVSSDAGKIVYWDGTTEAPTQDESGTYIIDTAEKLAYIASNTVSGSYKVADGIKAFVMQLESVAPISELNELSNYNATKAYFDKLVAADKDVKEWYAGIYSSGATFTGTLDGNGATVYGIYIKGIWTNANYTSDASSETATTNGNVWSHASGLLPIITEGTTVKNIAVKNSHIIAGGRVGALVGYVRTTGHGFVNIENCAVEGNFVATSNLSNVPSPGRNFAGVVLGGVEGSGTKWVGTRMTNCLVAGNRAENYHDHQVEGVIGSINASYDGVTGTEANNHAEKAYPNMSITDCIILDTVPYPTYGNHATRPSAFVNVYVNDLSIPMPSVNAGWDKAADYEGKVFEITAEQAKGAAAKTNLADLGWAEDGNGVWYTGAVGDYPSFKPASVMPTSIKNLYDAMSLDNFDNYGDSTDAFGVYGTSLNLKANPYISFTFAFLDAYKNDTRDQVSVTFKSGDTVIETVTAADMINNVSAGAGRYHLYRLKNVPVTALATGITVTASVDGGEAINLGTYSAEGFALLADQANKLVPCDYYLTRYEAAKALLFYTEMLNVRYGA